MARILKPDICVIGGGSGGLTVAAAAAAFGVPVVLIEKGKMGGDCLNYGCVPSKALIAAADRAQTMREASAFGIAGVEPDVNFGRVMRHVHSVIASIAPNDSVERFTAMGVHVIQAEARFKDRRSVIAGDTEIQARRFVIATGSSPQIPPITGIDTVPYLTNETLFEQSRKPGHLIVVGGGPVGIELAQAHRRLGAEVTVIEAAKVLAREDREAADIVLGRLADEGVAMCQDTEILRVEKRGKSGVRLHISASGERQTIDGTHLLVATGRAANVEGLGLKEAGIAFDGRGIKVSDRLRTDNRRVYAIGDATGAPQFTHVANHHAGLVVRALLFRLPARVGQAPVPRVTYTDPPLANVGLSEAEARSARKSVRILRWPYVDNDRARAERQTDGFIKIVADRKGRLLGAAIVGARADEMIGFWTLALSKKLGVRDVMDCIAPYPTLGEIGKRAALTYFSAATGRGSVRGIVRFLRVFG